MSKRRIRMNKRSKKRRSKRRISKRMSKRRRRRKRRNKVRKLTWSLGREKNVELGRENLSN